MHLFYDSTLNTWRLITEKLPDKPHLCNLPYHNRVKTFKAAHQKYLEDIAALKQNALTVGNTDLFWREDLNSDHIFIGNERFLIQDGKFYPWPGGVDILEKIPPVAILTLPEEKKNTMKKISKDKKWILYVQKVREEVRHETINECIKEMEKISVQSTLRPKILEALNALKR